MNKNEVITERYTDTKYIVTRNVINRKFTLWNGKEKISTKDVPDFERIIYPEEKKRSKK